MFTVARNSKTSVYEVHKDGCAHLNFPFMEVMVTGVVGESGNAVAKQSSEENEGCGYTTGPCVQRGKRPTYWGEW